MNASNYVPIFKPGTRELLFRYDPARGIIEIQERRVKYYIDLAEYGAPVSTEESDGGVEIHPGDCLNSARAN